MHGGALTLTAWALACTATVSTVQAKEPLERLTAVAVDLSTTPDARRSGPRTHVVDINIERWSTPEERDRLKGALREGGPDLLLKELRKLDETGRILTPGDVGSPLRFVWQMPLPDDGRRIIIATDRRIGFFEAVNRPRSADYPFLLLDLRLGADGKGQGKLLPLARIQVNDDHLVEIENYASEPVRLTQVRVVK